MSEHEEPIEMVVYNRATDCYEACIQIPGELFRRRLITKIEENPTVDLTDPQTYAAFIADIGSINAWLGRPHVKVLPPVKPEERKSEPLPKVGGATEEDGYSLVRSLREKARALPPYQWREILLTPLLDGVHGQEVKRPIYQKRHKEYQILDRLQEEWQQGIFVLDEEAARQERDHEAQNAENLNAKLETVKEAVNGNRFH